MSASATTILHADVDAFFASVEQRDDPRLRGRPVIVGPGVVMAASYEAKAFGIRSGMGARQARRLCPHAQVVAPRFPAYVEAGRALLELFRDTAPIVERMSMEEAFLDVRGLEAISGTPARIAGRLRRRVRQELGLPISVGVARTRVLAKLASRSAKPDGMRVIAPEHELAFLHPLRVEDLWGVGPATARRLHAYGITTVAEVAPLSHAALVDIVGLAAARHLHALAHNRDPRPLKRARRRRSFGAQSALGPWAGSRTELDRILVGLVERVTRRMRVARRVGRTVVLRLRFGDFTRATRSRTLPDPTAATELVLAAARALLAEARPLIERRGLTLLGVTVAGVEPAGEGIQLTLPLEGLHGEALDAVLDELRDRFGPGAVVRAAQLGRSRELSLWLFPGD